MNITLSIDTNNHEELFKARLVIDSFIEELNAVTINQIHDWQNTSFEYINIALAMIQFGTFTSERLCIEKKSMRNVNPHMISLYGHFYSEGIEHFNMMAMCNTTLWWYNYEEGTLNIAPDSYKMLLKLMQGSLGKRYAEWRKIKCLCPLPDFRVPELPKELFPMQDFDIASTAEDMIQLQSQVFPMEVVHLVLAISYFGSLKDVGDALNEVMDISFMQTSKFMVKFGVFDIESILNSDYVKAHNSITLEGNLLCASLVTIDSVQSALNKDLQKSYNEWRNTMGLPDF